MIKIMDHDNRPGFLKLKFPDVGHTEVRRYAALGKALHRGNGYAFRYRGMISNAFNGVSNTADHLNQQRGEIEFTSTGPVVSSQNGKYGRQSAIMWGNSRGAMTRPFQAIV
ncbi:Uncharacterized protein HZ326_2476 [Fusarium oxysporum f. sp. albedinis]|nr:Uncharacterized protein HZ326_2476 [Fusarium oxysporum f. sp. albedinis]